LQPRFAWLSKVARRGENLVQYLKISAGFVLDAKTFDNQVKARARTLTQIAPRAFARDKEAQSATLKKVTLARSIFLLHEFRS
jgi:hypothetical protein